MNSIPTRLRRFSSRTQSGDLDQPKKLLNAGNEQREKEQISQTEPNINAVRREHTQKKHQKQIASPSYGPLCNIVERYGILLGVNTVV